MPYAERLGVRIHYERFGAGTPLVLLHPLATNRYFWANQIFAFARDHEVLVLDHRGHGLSDTPPGGYAVPEMAADLLAVLDEASVPRALLVGDSMGGMVALQAALDAPDRCVALVIVSSATNLAPRVPPQVFRAYEERFEQAFSFMLDGSTAARTKRERPEAVAYLEGAFRARGNFTRDVFLGSLLDPAGIFHWNVADRLGELRQAALVLAGAEDQAVPLDATRFLAERIPGARFEVVPDSGHYLPLERPADFNTRLRAFLADLAG